MRHFLGFIVGNNNTSLIVGLSVRSITSLSTPKPRPPVGGRPYSRAVMKSSSIGERVAVFVSADEVFKPLRESRVVLLALGKRRILHGIVVYKRRLNELVLAESVE